MITNYTAEETVFGIPELRRHILGFYLDKKIVQRKPPKKCKDKAKEAAIIVATPPAQCCCLIYFFGWIAYRTGCFTHLLFVHP